MCLKRCFISHLIFFLAFAAFDTSLGKTITDSLSYYTQQLKKANNQYNTKPDESYLRYKACYRFFKSNRDTTRTLQCLINLSNLNRQKGRFSMSFDHLWEAQFLAKNTSNKNMQAKILIHLARLYDEFNMDSQSTKFLETALRLSKELYADNKQNTQNLIGSYMNLAVRQRKSGNYGIAITYLDSCQLLDSAQLDRPFLSAERGYIMMKQDKYAIAETYLRNALKNAKPIKPVYLVNIYMYLGELKMLTESSSDSAIYYLKASLRFVKNRKVSQRLVPDIYELLSRIYFKEHKYIRAYNIMAHSKSLSDSLVRIKNSTNGELFKIKNTYLATLNQRDAQLKRQHLELEKNRQIQLRLKIILGLIILLGVVLYATIRMRFKLKRTLLAKKEAELQKKLTESRAKDELGTKSRELTSYALQLIDKDSAIDDLLAVLKEESPQSYLSLKNKYKKGSKDLWDEFNLRFTEVNNAFYQRLETLHPQLSITEQKLCALIKLHFSTKEMGRILNIETHSVHIARSRIHKKIGLDRSANLDDYIAKL